MNKLIFLILCWLTLNAGIKAQPPSSAEGAALNTANNPSSRVTGHVLFTTTPDGKGGLIVTKYTGSDGKVVIPSTIDGLPVTSIGKGAFVGCPLTSVTIPDNVMSIGNGAFSDCNSLTTVTIPDSVTSIGDDAFSCCSKLTTAIIPNSVTSIGIGAFSGCTKLKSITVSASNRAFNSLDGVLFNKDQTTLIQYPAGKEGNTYTIPNSVTSIGNLSFGGRLTTETIPDTITSIGNGAFTDCHDLHTVTIGNGVTKIGYNAFGLGPTLCEVIFTGDAPTIKKWAFSGSPAICVYYHNGAKGFTSPQWVYSSEDSDTVPAVNLGSAHISTQAGIAQDPMSADSGYKGVGVLEAVNAFLSGFKHQAGSIPMATNLAMRGKNQIAITYSNNRIGLDYCLVDRNNVDLVVNELLAKSDDGSEAATFLRIELRSRTPDGIQVQTVGEKLHSVPMFTLMFIPETDSELKPTAELLRLLPKIFPFDGRLPKGMGGP